MSFNPVAWDLIIAEVQYTKNRCNLGLHVETIPANIAK
jgi:hypothetical protein